MKVSRPIISCVCKSHNTFSIIRCIFLKIGMNVPLEALTLSFLNVCNTSMAAFRISDEVTVAPEILREF
jgi:hypothetical protein